MDESSRFAERRHALLRQFVACIWKDLKYYLPPLPYRRGSETMSGFIEIAAIESVARPCLGFKKILRSAQRGPLGALAATVSSLNHQFNSTILVSNSVRYKKNLKKGKPNLAREPAESVTAGQC